MVYSTVSSVTNMKFPYNSQIVTKITIKEL